MKKTPRKALLAILFVIASGLIWSCRKQMTSSPDKISETEQSRQLTPLDVSGSVDTARSKMCSMTPWLRGIDNQHGYFYSYLGLFDLVIYTPNGGIAVPFGNEAVRIQTPGVTSESGASKAYCDAWNAAIVSLDFRLRHNQIPVSVPDIQAFMNGAMMMFWSNKGLIVERSPSAWPNLPWGGPPATYTNC